MKDKQGEEGVDEGVALAAARPAVQARSMATRDAVINALETLLEAHSIDQITIAQVAAEAGVSVGTIYRRFDGKHALREALLELYELRLAAWARNPENHLVPEPNASLRDVLEMMAAQMWRQINAMPALMRAAMVVSQADPDIFKARLEPMMAQSFEGFRLLFAHFSDDIDHPDHETATRMVFYFFQTILLEQGLYPNSLGQFSPPDDIDFPREIAAFAYGYLKLGGVDTQ